MINSKVFPLRFQVASSHLMDLTSRSFPLSKDPVLPPFEGDDLRRLAQEITKARRFLWKAQSFRYTLQAAPPICLVALGHPDPGGLLETRCPLVMGAFLQELLPCFSPPGPEIWASRRPSCFLSCPLGPNSRRKTTKNQMLLLFRQVFSGKRR